MKRLPSGLMKRKGPWNTPEAWGVHHRGPVSRLEGGTGPSGHVVAVADVAQIAAEARLHLKGDGGELHAPYAHSTIQESMVWSSPEKLAPTLQSLRASRANGNI